MSLLSTVTWGRRATLILSALTRAGVRDGKLLVVGAPGLARVLADRGRDVAVARAAAGAHDPLPFGDGELAALVAVSTAEPAAEWQRVVRAGGALVQVARLEASEMSRRALCAGLTDLVAARTGRHVVMSGRVSFSRPAPAP